MQEEFKARKRGRSRKEQAVWGMVRDEEKTERQLEKKTHNPCALSDKDIH